MEKYTYAAVFDLDGTLLNTIEDLADAGNRILAQNGYPTHSAEESKQLFGCGALNYMTRALPEGTDQETVLRLLKDYKEYYEAHSAIKTRPYDGVLDVLEHLRARGVAAIVVSNKPDPAVKLLCKNYFGDLVCFAEGDIDGVPRKPAPDHVERALERIGCPKAVFVGDSDVDVETARNAGLPCVAVTWGFRTVEQLKASGAETFADTACDLERAIFDILFDS